MPSDTPNADHPPSGKEGSRGSKPPRGSGSKGSKPYGKSGSKGSKPSRKTGSKGSKPSGKSGSSDGTRRGDDRRAERWPDGDPADNPELVERGWGGVARRGTRQFDSRGDFDDLDRNDDRDRDPDSRSIPRSSDNEPSERRRGRRRESG